MAFESLVLLNGRAMRAEIHSNIETVIYLAEYFGELKNAARQVASTINAVDRGYFTADEDEQVQAILVSYLQSRAALYDLIDESRDYAQRQPDERDLTFLIGYAGALVLIDAARFLREQTEQRPVVRRKLNQPVPTFDVPGGSYDMIQHSLTRTRHAWHLYHAIKYFDDNEARLRDFAVVNNLQSLVEIIDSLGERAEISPEQFTLTRLRTRTDQTLRRVGRTLFQRAQYGIQKFFSSAAADVYVRRGHQPSLPASIVSCLARVVEPGDVFVVRKEFAVTNYFLPGYWPHAALYLGTPDELVDLGVKQQELMASRWHKIETGCEDDRRRVLEAMKDGVLIRSWQSPLRSDSIIVLRPRLTANQRAAGITRGLAHEGKHYDFDFDFARADRLVCTEVVYRAYEGLGSVSFPLRKRAGRPTLSGADLVEMSCDGNGFDPIALYSDEHCGPRLCVESDLTQTIRSILAGS